MEKTVCVQQRHNTVVTTEIRPDGWEKRWHYYPSTEAAREAKKLAKRAATFDGINDKLQALAYSSQKLTDKQVADEIAKGWRKA